MQEYNSTSRRLNFSSDSVDDIQFAALSLPTYVSPNLQFQLPSRPANEAAATPASLDTVRRQQGVHMERNEPPVVYTGNGGHLANWLGRYQNTEGVVRNVSSDALMQNYASLFDPIEPIVPTVPMPPLEAAVQSSPLSPISPISSIYQPRSFTTTMPPGAPRAPRAFRVGVASGESETLSDENTEDVEQWRRMCETERDHNSQQFDKIKEVLVNVMGLLDDEMDRAAENTHFTEASYLQMANSLGHIHNIVNSS